MLHYILSLGGNIFVNCVHHDTTGHFCGNIFYSYVFRDTTNHLLSHVYFHLIITRPHTNEVVILIFVNQSILFAALFKWYKMNE